MSNRHRTKTVSPRKSERTMLEMQWRAGQKERAPFTGLADVVEAHRTDLVQKGISDLVADLMMVALATKSPVLRAAAHELIMAKLGTRKWRSRFREQMTKEKDVAHVRDLRMLMEAWDQIKSGASERQAAERAAAKHGAGASFDASVQRARELLRKKPNQTLRQARHPTRCW